MSRYHPEEPRPCGAFVTGTDTGIGKTVVACGLVRAALDRGLETVALKPVSAGCEETPEGLRNEDAELLRRLFDPPLPYDKVNPVALRAAAAPHLAAAEEGIHIPVANLAAQARAFAQASDFVVVEGAGGWRVPLDDHHTMADLALAMDVPVVLVVGIRLGCLNHALLTAEAVRRDGLPLAGWVANRVDPDDGRSDAQVGALRQRLQAPLLGDLPWMDRWDPSAVAARLDIEPLLSAL
ncbi:dethiobiotin synthase [Alkalilimnicola ehrlichii MLHE-1]|uniref:ATP-dependent dethiobiotin synthetase BioD n=1 Tax=Alkalilimnicola ehrlichii (strain ATCC BAA-1101 / DSM 17681 / MLHE-1) TaxID=187272 RepID=Q0ABZ0_ALKEH|nr:dethiobiotin synthase [Alkalilimnicola ehrlichii]ABI55647.1 dethiobiotin synthase [Alkalilimnicola ehrlichii MLHE-1]